ncbi:hypothetical protein [Klebsiella pneumoniae]|uniref:hypothetical protein n=1 Tax=Klebsiella pneumoniae TaxID=573 RepID=UPI0015523306|nr:hypothetical protein [Klebsiella pneumoniae]
MSRLVYFIVNCDGQICAIISDGNGVFSMGLFYISGNQCASNNGSEEKITAEPIHFSA